ncbi:4'-phosphopantetheinyl transferase family protein [Bacillus sp. mrc49]|uniref:4'-phosphopantetheinyl transferase family protein n=1 Tax=Bacillus sp. mrc49 TaxID=2054913 RepID=UPI000C26F749|nr:4'-phosphopantetheinyl transferase superfamily protein [Bacillus sp. mrc49]PJN90941.1 peptide transporter [Bacillus sp. mrc49]
MVEVYICTLPAKRSEGDLDELFAHVSTKRQVRLKRYHKVDDAYRSLIGDLLLRCILEKRYGLVRGDLEVETNAYGKPFLSKHPSIHYNISHSGEYVVCAFHDAEVGVDIEKNGPFDLELAKGFFTEEEYAEVWGVGDRLSAFYDMWTLKESYIKAVGKGLSIPLRAFNVSRNGMDDIQLTDVRRNKPIADYTCKQFRVDSEYSLAVCAHQGSAAGFSDQPIFVTIEGICEGLKINPKT